MFPVACFGEIKAKRGSGPDIGWLCLFLTCLQEDFSQIILEVCE